MVEGRITQGFAGQEKEAMFDSKSSGKQRLKSYLCCYELAREGNRSSGNSSKAVATVQMGDHSTRSRMAQVGLEEMDRFHLSVSGVSAETCEGTRWVFP